MAKQKPYRFVLYCVARMAAAVLSLLPRRAALALARWAGWISFYAVGRQRNNILKSLRTAFGHEVPESRIQILAKKVLGHALQTAVEVLQFSKLTAQKVEKFVDAGNAFSVYESLLKEGHGIISITAHLGNWELLAGVFTLHGFEGAVVARKIYYEPYNRWIVGLRESVGVHTIYRDQSAREILGVLKRNQIVGLLPDQDIEGLQGVFVDFFGKPAYTPIAPVKLALASGAPILPSFLVREAGDRYRVVLGDVIRPVVDTTREEAEKKFTEAWMNQFEKVIRQYPEQWAWMHNRWKTERPSAHSERQEVLKSA